MVEMHYPVHLLMHYQVNLSFLAAHQKLNCSSLTPTCSVGVVAIPLPDASRPTTVNVGETENAADPRSRLKWFASITATTVPTT